MRRTGRAHLIFLLEAIALRCLHLVDMLQKVSHPYCGVQLSCVIWGALPATRAPRGAPQEAAGLGDPTASLVSCSQRKGKGLSHTCKPSLEASRWTRAEWRQGAQSTWKGTGSFLRVKLSKATLHESLQALPFGISGFPSTK